MDCAAEAASRNTQKADRPHGHTSYHARCILAFCLSLPAACAMVFSQGSRLSGPESIRMILLCILWSA